MAATLAGPADRVLTERGREGVCACGDGQLSDEGARLSDAKVTRIGVDPNYVSGTKDLVFGGDKELAEPPLRDENAPGIGDLPNGSLAYLLTMRLDPFVYFSREMPVLCIYSWDRTLSSDEWSVLYEQYGLRTDD